MILMFLFKCTFITDNLLAIEADHIFLLLVYRAISLRHSLAGRWNGYEILREPFYFCFLERGFANWAFLRRLLEDLCQAILAQSMTTFAYSGLLLIFVKKIKANWTGKLVHWDVGVGL